METNFRMMRELIKEKHFKPKKRGVLYANEIAIITDTLHLDEMDIIQLRNLRDFTVLYLRSSEREMNEDFKKCMEKSDICSGITCLIDTKIFNLGGEI